MEFVLQTPEQESWAIDRLAHVVAFQTLLAAGKYPGRDVLDIHSRLPLRCPISPEPSELTWLTVGPPDGFATTFELSSGVVDLLTIVGITEDEAAFARAEGGHSLLTLLRQNDAFPITDWKRGSVVGAA